MPLIDNYYDAIHEWHESSCCSSLDDELHPSALLCAAWINSRSDLPAVCFVDTSNRLLN